MAEDRRVRKTKKAICDVFCELTKDKKLNEITIKELCAKADINKSTFYLHYRDIYDLAETIENELIREYVRSLKNIHIMKRFEKHRRCGNGSGMHILKNQTDWVS